MTTIIADRRGMAADRQTTHGDQKAFGVKIFRVRETIIGMAGDAPLCEQYLEWVEGGEKPDVDEDAEIDVLILTRNSLYFCSGNFTRMKIDDPFYAIGTGSQAALAAMHMGANPVQAVEIACKIDPSSGIDSKGVDYIKL